MSVFEFTIRNFLRCALPWATLLVGTAQADEASIAAGQAIATDRNGGNCLSCHAVAGGEMAGNSGPPLVQMALRYPKRELLRAQIYDPRQRNPNTVMPPYGAHGILSDRELDFVVDYILSL